jgi:hypothetical protein
VIASVLTLSGFRDRWRRGAISTLETIKGSIADCRGFSTGID